MLVRSCEENLRAYSFRAGLSNFVIENDVLSLRDRV